MRSYFFAQEDPQGNLFLLWASVRDSANGGLELKFRGAVDLSVFPLECPIIGVTELDAVECATAFSQYNIEHGMPEPILGCNPQVSPKPMDDIHPGFTDWVPVDDELQGCIDTAEIVSLQQKATNGIVG